MARKEEPSGEADSFLKIWLCLLSRPAQLKAVIPTRSKIKLIIKYNPTLGLIGILCEKNLTVFLVSGKQCCETPSHESLRDENLPEIIYGWG